VCVVVIVLALVFLLLPLLHMSGIH
jgi:hypothetical protein